MAQGEVNLGVFTLEDAGMLSGPVNRGSLVFQTKSMNGRQAGVLYRSLGSGLWEPYENNPAYPGTVYKVDANVGSNSNSGLEWGSPFLTMAKAFSVITNGDTILFCGKIKEQLVTPVQVFDVTVRGVGNRPRHADAAPVGSALRANTWTAPAVPVAGQALVRVLQQGWKFENILFAAAAGCACIEPVRNAAADNDERDASHITIAGCRFAGVASTDSGIKFGSTDFTEIVNNALIIGNDFQGLAHAIKEHSAGLQFRMKLFGNDFQSNTNHIALGGYNAKILGNIFGLWTTTSVKLDGGTGSSLVTQNYLWGDYSTASNHYVSGTGDEWSGNWSSDEAETEVLNGITVAVPAA